MNPATHVLVVSADEDWRAEVVQGLNQAASRLDNPFGLMAIGCPCGDAAVDAVLATAPTQADLQVVVIDHGPRGTGARGNPAVTTAQRGDDGAAHSRPRSRCTTKDATSPPASRSARASATATERCLPPVQPTARVA